jgi:hypothetical protein
MFTNPTYVQDAIRGLEVNKVPGTDDIPNRALKHLPQLMILLLVALFNVIVRAQDFPPVSTL